MTTIELWQEMADMTLAKCRATCKILGSCCSEEYCSMAKSIAAEHGVKLLETGGKIPFLDSDGRCIVPPHLRPLCSLHQCKINGLGFDPKDPEWTEQYFNLRSKLNEE